MTRHGVVQTSAAGAQPPATDPRTPMVTAAADRPTTSNVRGRQYRSEAQRSGLCALTSALYSNGLAEVDIGCTSKSP